MTQAIPIAVQVAEVERELVVRDRAYPVFIARGSLDAREAKERVAHLQAALATLRIVQRHADALRTLIRYLAAADLAPGEVPTVDERAALRANPAVAALLDAFPGAELGEIRPVAYPEPEPGHPDLFDREDA